MYDYKEAVLSDVREYIEDNYDQNELVEWLSCGHNRTRFHEKLYDDMFCDDGVTGNASGSYTFNAYQAEENLCHNMYLLGEALSEYGCGPEYMSEKGAEACDVTIRCYLLSECIGSVLDDLESELEDEIEAFNNPEEDEEEDEE